MRWRFLPGSDLYLVYRNDFDLSDQIEPRDKPLHELTIKAAFYWRALLGAARG